MHTKWMQHAIAAQSLFVVANSPARFADFVQDEIPRCAIVVNDAGIEPQ